MAFKFPGRFFHATAAMAGLAYGMFGPTKPLIPDFNLPKVEPGSSYRKRKAPRAHKANLRLHLGPSSPGRLMRNRTPDPVPVRLVCHDWFRRAHFGSSKRVKNMTPDEIDRANKAMEAFRAKKV